MKYQRRRVKDIEEEMETMKDNIEAEMETMKNNMQVLAKAIKNIKCELGPMNDKINRLDKSGGQTSQTQPQLQMSTSIKAESKLILNCIITANLARRFAI